MRIELTADPGKKKESLTKLRKGSYQYGVYAFFIKAFALFRWLAPLLVVLIETARTASRGYGFKNYEAAALIINCVVLFAAFSIGKALLSFLVDKMTGGLCMDNKDERIVIEGTTLSYSFTKKGRRMLEKIPLEAVEIKINEEIDALSFAGKIVICEEKKNGSLSAPKEKEKEILLDYYEPSLIETLNHIKK